MFFVITFPCRRIILKILLLETVVWLLLYLVGFQNMLCGNEQEEDDWPVTRQTRTLHIRISLFPKNIAYSPKYIVSAGYSSIPGILSHDNFLEAIQF